MKHHYGKINQISVSLTILISLLLFQHSASAQSKEQTEKLTNRIEKLEKQADLNKKFAELAKELKKNTIAKRFENIDKKYNNDIMSLKNEYQALKNDLKKEQILFWILITIIIIAGVSQLIHYFFFIPKHLKKKLEKKIEDYFDNRMQYIKYLIKSQRIESDLKADKHILIIGEDSTEDNKLRDLLHKMKFQKVDAKQLNDLYDEENQTIKNSFKENNYNLIIFCKLAEEKINEYTSVSAMDLFVIYSFDYLKNLKFRERINLANSPTTLYARTMETLLYQDVIKR